MTLSETQEKILSLLELNRGHYVSGEAIAEQLAISRAAVWKQIRGLREAGVLIEASARKGYTLSPLSDHLSAAGIRTHLPAVLQAVPLEVLSVCSSTNQLAKEALAQNLTEGFILADEQTAGRGRRGKQFHSPAGKGIYLSYYFRPRLHISHAHLITCAAAVLAARAAAETCALDLQIKWVNDLFLNGRKVGGILTEAVTDFENGQVTGAVVGIGINYQSSAADWPDELREIAGSLYTDDSGQQTQAAKSAASAGQARPSRNQLAAALIDKLTGLSGLLDQAIFERQILPEYQARCLLLQKPVLILAEGRETAAVARAITARGHLLCELSDGQMLELQSGEVSVRPQ